MAKRLGPFGFQSLQQRLAVLPVIVAVLVSIGAYAFVHRLAGQELYNSRQQLAQGLTDSVAKRLSAELSSIRDELDAWSRYHARLLEPTMAPAVRQRIFQDWLEGLGHRDPARYDLVALVDADGTVVAVNELGLRAMPQRRILTSRFLGQPITALVGESTIDWLKPTLAHNRISGLAWRQIREVENAYVEPQSVAEPATQRRTHDVPASHQIVLAVPVLSESRQQARGAMVGVLSWRPFQEIVDEAERYLAKVGLNSGYGFLFDTSGDRVIAHKLRDPDVLPYRNILGQSVSRDFTLPQVAEAARHARGTAFEYDFPPGTRKFAVFAAVDPQNSDQAFAFDWRLGIGVDHSDIFAPLARLRRAAIGATLVLAVAIAGVGVWLGRRLSLSVNEFTHLVHEAAEGRFQLLQASASHDEISELGTALNRLLVSMRQQAELQPVPNPYVVGNPVRTANMFYGRDEDLRWIGDRLSHPGNEIIILYGQRRIGKTSLLHQVRNRRGLTGLQPIFLDTHALVPSIQSDADFYAGIGRAIDAELPSPTGQGATVQSARHLVALLAQLNAAFPNDVVVLLFDEVEALETVVANNTLTSAISSFLSSLLESDVRVSLIVTGSNDGSRLAGPFWSMLTPKAISRRIGLLSRAEGLRLITEPTSGQIDFDDGVPDYVLRYTGAHPYYTQTFCQRLIDTLNERHTRCASRGTVDNVAAQLLAEPPLPLDDMWHNLTPLQRWLMAEIGRLLEGPESTVRADALWINAQATHADPTAIGLELRRLTTIELLEETPTGYRMPVDFIRLWIRHEQLWWQVAREWQAHARR